MKIQNKKTFIFGVFSLLLAALNIITFIMNKTFNIGWIVIIIVLLFTGTVSVIRGTAKKNLPTRISSKQKMNAINL